MSATVLVSRDNRNRDSHRTILRIGRGLRITNSRAIDPLNVGLRRSRTLCSRTIGRRTARERSLMRISLMSGQMLNQRRAQGIAP